MRWIRAVLVRRGDEQCCSFRAARDGSAYRCIAADGLRCVRIEEVQAVT